MTHQSTNQRSVTILLYNIFNAFLLYIVFHGAFVINADGPGGFGESIIKAFLFFISISIFILGLASTGVFNKPNNQHYKINYFLAIVATIILVFSSGVMIADACSNDNGYCRNWSIQLLESAMPNQSMLSLTSYL